jgi:hypothetical protein
LSSEAPPAGVFVASRDGGGGTVVSGDVKAAGCASTTCGGVMYSVAQNTKLTWMTPSLLSWPIDAPSGLHNVTLRVGVPVDGDRVDMMVRAIGILNGREATVSGLFGVPWALQKPVGGDNAKTVLNMVQVEVASGVDSADLLRIEVELRGAGTVHIADLLLQP